MVVRHKIGGILTWLHPQVRATITLHSFKTNSKRPLKIGHQSQKETIVFQPPIFRCFPLAVSFEGPICSIRNPVKIQWKFGIRKAHQNDSLRLPKNPPARPLCPVASKRRLGRFPAGGLSVPDAARTFRKPLVLASDFSEYPPWN